MLRRWLRYLLIPAALIAVLVGFGLWRLSKDDERLTRWLADSVQSATGLRLQTEATGRFGFWPQLSIALNEVSLRAPADTPVRIGSIRVQVPWSGVFGRELRASRIVLQNVDLDAAAIDNWLASRDDQGPMPAWRWPKLDAALLIENLRYHAHDADGADITTFSLERLLLDRWTINEAASMSARFHLPALATEPLQLQLTCTPRQTRNALALEPCNASIGIDAGRSLALRGYLRRDDNTRAEVQLRVEAAQLPEWIVLDPIQTEARPVDLVVRLTGSFVGPLKVNSGGNIAGSKIDIDAVLPYGWIDLLKAGDWDALASRATGAVHIDHLRSADVQLEDLRWRNEAASEQTTAAVSRQ